MAAQREGFPYGSRWGFRTPSPDFARTAVEPLSPYPTSTPICYTRESSISNDNAPSSTSSIPPQYPSAVPLHNAQEHHLPAQAVANNSYNPPHIASEIPPSNPLDTLADIALLHGAGQLTSSHCIPPSHSPVLPTEGFRGPDYHHIGGVTTIPVGPSNVRRNSLHETSYGPIGYERRAHSTGREIEFINTPIPRRPSITLSELLSPQEEPPLEYSEARGLPRGNAFSRSPEMARSSTAAYSDQRLLPAASGADIRVNGYTSSSSRVALVTEDTTMHDQQTTQPEQPLTPVQNQSKEDHLALDSASTSLPTPTQEDHVIASSVASGCDQSEKMKTGTNLTPECTEAENLVKASASNQSVNKPRSRRSSSRMSRPPEIKKSTRKPKAKTSSNEPGSSQKPSGEEENCQTCKVHYSQDDGRNGAWIGCDGCKGWHHARCLQLDQATVDKIDKFYCVACEPTHGKSTWKRSSGRARTAIDYDALHNGSSAPVRNPADPRIHPYINKIVDKSYKFAPDNLRRLRPELVTASVIDNTDKTWEHPFIVPAKLNPAPWHSVDVERLPPKPIASGTSIPRAPELPQNGTRKRSGTPINEVRESSTASNSSASSDWEQPEKRLDADALGMRIPPGLTVRCVAEMVGVDKNVPMMDVVTQEPPKDHWSMGRLADYFESPVKEAIYNCISCEVSNSPLGRMISRPQAVRESDLVDRVWKHVPANVSKPTVGKYVLMSVKDSFTDFHVDFGGSSVFYHIYEGRKVFLVIQPTEKALKTYEKWSSSAEMNYTFLPDLLPDMPCRLITLEKGDTFFIPSGWIHAVYTPVDSLVIGGNFLTRNFYVNQMKVHTIEAVTGVPKQMRYPRYTTLMWAAMFNYIESERMPREIERDILSNVLAVKSRPKNSHQAYTIEELKGFPALLDFLYRNVMIVMGVITSSQRVGQPKLGKTIVEAVRKAIPPPIQRNPLLYLKHFARWCYWKRATCGLVETGERIPEWAQASWFPPGHSAPPAPVVAPVEPAVQCEGELAVGDIPRRDGLRDRSKLSTSPDAVLEDFDYFPGHPVTPSAFQARHYSITSKRKNDGRLEATSSSKKTKTTRGSRQTTLLPPLGDAKKATTDQYLQLTDGSIYVKKLSNLGPPRIGCESCRLKKTGCKHKEEIRARGWCDDEKAVVVDRVQREDETEVDYEEEAVEASPTKAAPTKPPAEPRTEFTPVLATPAQKSTPRKAGESGPPSGYKGRKPSCDDCKVLKKKCLHQETWKLAHDKLAAQEAKKAQKKTEQVHRRQEKLSRRKATVDKQKATVETPTKIIETPTKVAPAAEPMRSVILRSPPTLRPTPPKLAPPPGITSPAPTPTKAASTPVELVAKAAKEPPMIPIKSEVPAEPMDTIEATQHTVPDASVKPPSAPRGHVSKSKSDSPKPTSSRKRGKKTPSPEYSPKTPNKKLPPALDLDSSILNDTPAQYTTIPITPVDATIMAPPIDDTTRQGSPTKQTPRTPKVEKAMHPPVTPCAPEIQQEYIAALHRGSVSGGKTYTSGNKSIKRKAEEESPEQIPARKAKKDSPSKAATVGSANQGGSGGSTTSAGSPQQADRQTTFENLRQLSLGLRVRGQSGGAVC
ncbi:hypothetical protein FPQ18DRAFT_90917 [Pyronema domesticum]|nr:hypothetical protein FPQ18DRAFT_90917 [Pyronema domesticum]